MLISDLLMSSSDDNTKDCRKNPMACFRQVVIDGMVIVVMFTFLSWHINHELPAPTSLIDFMTVWTPMLFVLKAMDLEYSDQLARVAGWTLGTKVFNILTI